MCFFGMRDEGGVDGAVDVVEVGGGVVVLVPLEIASWSCVDRDEGAGYDKRRGEERFGTY